MAKFLMEYNVDPRRVAVVPWKDLGSTDPFAENGDHEGRQANRSVEIYSDKGTALNVFESNWS